MCINQGENGVSAVAGRTAVTGRILVAWLLLALGIAGWLSAVACTANPSSSSAQIPVWERDNPIKPLPTPPLGIDTAYADLPDPPKPARVRLGRWLFFDARLSSDGNVSCATCHRPDHAFSEPLPVSTGVHGLKGTRKAQTFINQAWTIYPRFFWDGRAASLEAQALLPISTPNEMGMPHAQLLARLRTIRGYEPYFREAFGAAAGSDAVTIERIAKALADYERTRLSGNSAWDRWRQRRDESAVSAQVKAGHALFFGKAACNQCHLGQNFTDSQFHNVGIGWQAGTKTFADRGRFDVTKKPADLGAFKTPTLRDLRRRGPYMHDGSVATLREVMDLYTRGGTANPHLSPKVKALRLSPADVDALIAFMDALNSDDPPEVAPRSFPQ